MSVGLSRWVASLPGTPSGKALDTMPRGEILMAIEGAYERQLRFPLDTANQLRGRLRREHFTIFKKGSKGVSYVCAVKRKFRVANGKSPLGRIMASGLNFLCIRGGRPTGIE